MKRKTCKPCYCAHRERLERTLLKKWLLIVLARFLVVLAALLSHI